MSITVERFLDTVSDYKVKVLTDNIGLDNLIDWFHIVENNYSIDYIKEKELVFSSGATLEDIGGFKRFVERIIAANCSGLVISEKHLPVELPMETVALCEKKQFPIIVLSTPSLLSDIIKLLSIQLLESEKANKQLFAAMKNAISFPKKAELYVPTFTQYGFKRGDTYTSVIIKLNQGMNNSSAQWIVKSIERQLLSAGDKSFILTMDDFFLIVFSDYSEQQINDIVLNIIVQLRMKELSFYVGVSHNLHGIDKLSQTYLQAKHVIDLSERVERKNVMVRYDELGAYQLLLAIENKEILRNYYDDLLGKVALYDKNNGSDLVPFLEAYFVCNCNISETSEKLFIHRNTVIYKIKKINEILECDLAEISVRAQIYLAIMMSNIMD